MTYPCEQKTLTKSWWIMGTIPNTDQKYKHYGKNINFGVTAQTMEGAMSEARKVHPEIWFVNCNHRGDIHLQEESRAGQLEGK